MLKNSIPFEIHITVEKLSPDKQPTFIELCILNEAKPLFIELAKGNYISQPMISKVVCSNSFESVLSLATNLSKKFSKNNFNVNRLKVEVPSENSLLFNNFYSSFEKYFEWHAKINFINIDALSMLCKNHMVHLSLNALKNEPGFRFITLREFGKKIIFESRISNLISDLEKGHWTISKIQSEYCIYDNNKFLDTGWLTQ
jgi:hypothetical protein